MVHRTTRDIYEDVFTIKGTLINDTILDVDELQGSAKMLAISTLKPNSAIGWHEHIGQCEHYYILEGSGVFTQPDGNKVPVKTGDVCTITFDQGHGIENNSDTDLVILAIIIDK